MTRSAGAAYAACLALLLVTSACGDGSLVLTGPDTRLLFDPVEPYRAEP